MARLRPYAIALCWITAGVLMRLALNGQLGRTQLWLTFWPITFLAAWTGGARAGITAMLGSIVVAGYWLIEPRFHFDIDRPHAIGAVMFAACSSGFIWVAERARRSRELDRERAVEAEAQRAALEELHRSAEVAREAAVEASQAKDEFLAMLGHELRNPLAPITTAVELMRMRGQTSRELDVIGRQVQHMVRLVDDLLDISRIVRGTIELRRAPVELRTVIDKALEMVAPVLERTGHRVEVEVAPGIVVDGDLQRLTQVLSNLLVNAIKFSPAGTTIDVRAERRDGQARVRVIDRGVGIEPELLATMFEPFVQGRQQSDRARGGLGLGLAIARRIVELHGGTIRATSEGKGRGTEIAIEVPSSGDAPVVARPVSAPHARPHRILVVDDNVDIASLLATALEARGHAVCVAHDGPQALHVAAGFEPTVALLDIGLPVMDGYELARQLHARGVAAPMIAITGYGQPTDRARTRDAGFVEHLVKPVDLTQLDRVIERL